MDDKVSKLVNEMGFQRAEAIMALTETNGNIDSAIENLLQQKYAPPPYSDIESCSVTCTVESPDGGNSTFEKVFTSSSFEKQLFNTATAPMDIPAEFALPCLPPPYEKVNTVNKVRDWEDKSNVFHINEKTAGSLPIDLVKYAQKRCSVCFNEISTLAEDGMKHIEGDIVQQNSNYFHYPCFTKKYGPKCAYCCFPLSLPDKDHELSGQYLVYKGRDYHVECYTKYAGPRCSYCCNVIVEVAGGEYSGKRIVDGLKEYHVECYQKKVYAIWRAKNS